MSAMGSQVFELVQVRIHMSHEKDVVGSLLIWAEENSCFKQGTHYETRLSVSGDFLLRRSGQE